jgi:scyllo-inositol 2-dehydrogenase (NADP+)
MINVGIMGVGRIAEDVHIPAIEKTPGLRLHSLGDATPARLDRARERYEGVTLHSDYEKFLADAALALVVIATPTSLHRDHVCRALAARKSLVVEKPMACSSKEADEMLAAAKKAGTLFTVYHNRRLDSDYLTVKAAVDSGVLGKILSIGAHLTGSGSPEGYAVEEFNTRWRLEKKWGGGALYDWGSHLIDQTLQLAAGKPVSVWADMRNAKWSSEVDDHDQVMIRFEDGSIGEIQVTYVCWLSLPRWVVYGSEGTLRSSLDGWEDIEIHARLSGLEGSYRPKPIPSDWHRYYRNLAAALEGKEEIMVKPVEAALVVDVIDAAMRSAATGEVVQLPTRPI